MSVPALPPTSGAPVSDEGQVVIRERVGADGRKIFEIVGEIVVSGRVQKPTAFYVLDRQSIGWKPDELGQNFIPRILRSVEEPLF